MSNVLLTIHLILALLLISAVLLQRSEGGGLGSTGGDGNALMSGRSAATAMTKLTWLLATAFLCTSIALTVLSAKKASVSSIIAEDIGDPDQSIMEIPLPKESSLESLGLEASPTTPPVEE
ncbi:MAG: preprotein translocase subunit SecG [Pseudomonadota bacterium]|nr:preprotein translocase subunit SecG [Pseudomonadota bacterium]